MIFFNVIYRGFFVIFLGVHLNIQAGFLNSQDWPWSMAMSPASAQWDVFRVPYALVVCWKHVFHQMVLFLRVCKS
jgi:hypothetical protein